MSVAGPRPPRSCSNAGRVTRYGRSAVRVAGITTSLISIPAARRSAALLELLSLRHGDAAAHGEVHGSGQHVGDDGVRVRDELHLDLVDLRSPEDVLVEGGDGDPGAVLEVLVLEGPVPYVFRAQPR